MGLFELLWVALIVYGIFNGLARGKKTSDDAPKTARSGGVLEQIRRQFEEAARQAELEREGGQPRQLDHSPEALTEAADRARRPDLRSRPGYFGAEADGQTAEAPERPPPPGRRPDLTSGREFAPPRRMTRVTDVTPDRVGRVQNLPVPSPTRLPDVSPSGDLVRSASEPEAPLHRVARLRPDSESSRPERVHHPPTVARSRAGGFSTDFLRRMDALPPLRRAILYGEILGKPRALDPGSVDPRD